MCVQTKTLETKKKKKKKSVFLSHERKGVLRYQTYIQYSHHRNKGNYMLSKISMDNNEMINHLFYDPYNIKNLYRRICNRTQIPQLR